LNVGPTCSFSECDVTSVASKSTTSGLAASVSWSGAWTPASVHTRARAVARAVLIAANAAGASAASAAIVRETVGSDVTSPYKPGSPRSTATSARQSPPRARVTAKSMSTLAGSWTANGLRHGASAGPSPAAATVSVSSTPPA